MTELDPAAAAGKLIAELRGEGFPDDRTARRLHAEGLLCGAELVWLAEAARSSPQDATAVIRRIIRRYNGTDLAAALRALLNPTADAPVVATSGQRRMPPPTLDGFDDDVPVSDPLESLRILRNALEDGIPRDDYLAPMPVGALIDILDQIVGVRETSGD